MTPDSYEKDINRRPTLQSSLNPKPGNAKALNPNNPKTLNPNNPKTLNPNNPKALNPKTQKP